MDMVRASFGLAAPPYVFGTTTSIVIQPDPAETELPGTGLARVTPDNMADSPIQRKY